MKTTKEALDYLFEEYQKYAPTKMVEGIECFTKEGADWFDSIIIVKRELEKSLKALDIIKKKRVNIGDFARCKNIEDYNEYCCYNEKEQLTQEEYDLLKEVLQ